MICSLYRGFLVSIKEFLGNPRGGGGGYGKQEKCSFYRGIVND